MMTPTISILKMQIMCIKSEQLSKKNSLRIPIKQFKMETLCKFNALYIYCDDIVFSITMN